MPRFFFLLSGEHENLPLSELIHVLKAENQPYSLVETLPQVARLKCELEALNPIAKRAALTRVCSMELFSCEADFKEIVSNMRSTPFDQHLNPGDTFAVRVSRVRGYSRHLGRAELEKKLGALIFQEIKGSRVNLKHPGKTFFAVLTRKRLCFGLKIAEVATKPFVERRPRKKLFFHPSAMQPKLARCMVNLAEPKRGDLLLDPFCGTSSILVEAGLIGCRVVGSDVDHRMVRGSMRNLSQNSVTPLGLLIADARSPPYRRVDCVVTDPPYGRSSSTLGFTTREIVKDMLAAVDDVLPRGGKVCLATPEILEIRSLIGETSLNFLESHLIYVHRSLTREVSVLER